MPRQLRGCVDVWVEGRTAGDAGVDPDGGGRADLAWCWRTHHWLNYGLNCWLTCWLTCWLNYLLNTWPNLVSNQIPLQIPNQIPNQYRCRPTPADMQDRVLLDGGFTGGHLLGQVAGGLGERVRRLGPVCRLAPGESDGTTLADALLGGPVGVHRHLGPTRSSILIVSVPLSAEGVGRTGLRQGEVSLCDP